MYSLASLAPAKIDLNHQDLRRSVPFSTRRIRSPSLTIPNTLPLVSITGSALILCSSSKPAISRTSVSGVTVMTLGVMTSTARIGTPPGRVGRVNAGNLLVQELKRFLCFTLALIKVAQNNTYHLDMYQTH